MSRPLLTAVAGLSRSPTVRALSSRMPVVLLYHGVPAERGEPGMDAALFERHVRFLKEHCEPIRADALDRPRGRFDPVRVLLTFDDGLRNNAEVAAPILRRYGVPAVFFVSSRHAAGGRYLWFSYLSALEAWFPGSGFTFMGQHVDMSPGSRVASLEGLRRQLLALRPHPAAMYDAIESEGPRLEEFVPEDRLKADYSGMTPDQVADLAADPLFTLGVHTVDHPFLPYCEPDEIRRQLERNKAWLEQVGGRPCDSVAYPSGAYDPRVLDLCRELGLGKGYAVIPSVQEDPDLEVPRVGIYDPSLDILAFKVQWGNLLRRLRINVG